MQSRFQRITPFLWFDGQAEEAANFYVSIFENSRLVNSTRYSGEVVEASGQKEGSVMTVAFELDGQSFTALNGGPMFRFTEALSLVINCKNQDEIDHYWIRLSQGGEERAQQCGWLKDRFGLSWQVVPIELVQLLTQTDPKKGRKAMDALMQMKKIDVERLRKAAAA